jgi:hypothetical protein
MAGSEIILYSTPQGEIKIEVILQDETVWLTQRAMGELFGVSKKTISEHLGNIYKSNELQREATVRKIRTVQNEGEREVARNLEFYNLDAIISVGYRVNSHQATLIRNRIVLPHDTIPANRYVAFMGSSKFINK